MNKKVWHMYLQKLLFILSFLTFGAGDGITAAYMIKKEGIISESNQMMRLAYATGGMNSLISIKIWLSFLILFFVWLIRSKDNYWTINGFLFSLFIGGIMAIGANLMAARGMTPPSPDWIIFTYLFLVILFVMLGDALDKIKSDRPHERHAI